MSHMLRLQVIVFLALMLIPILILAGFDLSSLENSEFTPGGKSQAHRYEKLLKQSVERQSFDKNVKIRRKRGCLTMIASVFTIIAAVVTGIALFLPTGGTSVIVAGGIAAGAGALAGVTGIAAGANDNVCDSRAKLKKIVEEINKDNDAYRKWLSTEMEGISKRMGITSQLTQATINSIDRQIKISKLNHEQKKAMQIKVQKLSKELKQQASFLESVAEDAGYIWIENSPSNYDTADENRWINQLLRNRDTLRFSNVGSIGPKEVADIFNNEVKNIDASKIENELHAQLAKDINGFHRSISRHSFLLSQQMMEQSEHMLAGFIHTSHVINEGASVILTAVESLESYVTEIKNGVEVVNANIVQLEKRNQKRAAQILNATIIINSNIIQLQTNLTNQFKHINESLIMALTDVTENFTGQIKDLKKVIKAEFDENAEQINDVNFNVLNVNLKNKIEIIRDTYYYIMEVIEHKALESNFTRKRMESKCFGNADPKTFLDILNRQLFLCTDCNFVNLFPNKFAIWRKAMIHATTEAIFSASFCMAYFQLDNKGIIKKLEKNSKSILDVLGKSTSIEDIAHAKWWYKNITKFSAELKGLRSNADLKELLSRYGDQVYIVGGIKTAKVLNISSPNATVPGFMKLLAPSNAVESGSLYCCNPESHLCSQQLDIHVFCQFTAVWFYQLPGSKEVLVVNWKNKISNKSNSKSLPSFIQNFVELQSDFKNRVGYYFDDFSNYAESFFRVFPWLTHRFPQLKNKRSTTANDVDQHTTIVWKLIVMKDTYCWGNNAKYMLANPLRAGCTNGLCNWKERSRLRGGVFLSIYQNTSKETCCEICHLSDNCHAVEFMYGVCRLISRPSKVETVDVSGIAVALIIYINKCQPTPCEQNKPCIAESKNEYSCACATECWFKGCNCETEKVRLGTSKDICQDLDPANGIQSRPGSIMYYSAQHGETPWRKAKKKCSTTPGSVLVTIKNDDELRYLVKYLTWRAIWLGFEATKNKSTGMTTWADGGFAKDFVEKSSITTMWTGDCGYLDTDVLKFSTANCLAPLPYICQLECPNKAQCPEGYSPSTGIRGRPGFFMCYSSLQKKSSFKQAKEHCAMTGSSIVTIKHREEYKHLISMTNKPIWLGFEGEKNISAIVWSDGGFVKDIIEDIAEINWSTITKSYCGYLNERTMFSTSMCRRKFYYICQLKCPIKGICQSATPTSGISAAIRNIANSTSSSNITLLATLTGF